MSDLNPAVGSETRSNGKRWYDANRMVLILGGALWLIAFSIGCFSLGSAVSAQSKNAEQDVRIESLKADLEKLGRGIDRMEIKLDRALEKK